MPPRSPEEILASLDATLGKPISGLNDNIGKTPAPSLFNPPPAPAESTWSKVGNGLLTGLDYALKGADYALTKPIQTVELAALNPLQQLQDMFNNGTQKGITHTFDSWNQNGQNFLDQMKDLWSKPFASTAPDAINNYFGTNSANNTVQSGPLAGLDYSPGNLLDLAGQTFGPSGLGALAKAGKATVGSIGLENAARSAAEIPGIEGMGPETPNWSNVPNDLGSSANIGDIPDILNAPSKIVDSTRPSNVNFPQFTPKKWSPAGTDEASQELEQLLNLAKENGVPAGREYEYLQGLYPTMAGREGVSFDELLNQIKNPLDALEAKKVNAYGVPSTEAVKGLLKYPEFLNETNASLGSKLDEIPDFLKGIEEAAPTSSSNTLEDLGGILKNPDIAKEIDGIYGAKPKKSEGVGEVKSVNNNAAKTFDDFVNEANVEKLPTHEFDPTPLKDISVFNARWNDLYRNTAKVFAKAPQALKAITEKYLNPFNDAKKANFVEQKEITDRLKNEVTSKGIGKGSKESAAVQAFGEGRLTKAELQKQFPSSWQKIENAEQFFRKEYNNLIDRQNAVLTEAYPNDPSKLIKKRSDYFHHFNELHDMFKGAMNLFESPGAAQSLVTKPSNLKRKAQEFMNTRNGKQFTDDAVGGFLKYLPGATYTIHITPQINQFRKLADALATQTRISGTPKVQNYIQSLRELADDLAGMPNPIDKVAKGVVPEKVFNVANYINNRVKTNMVLGSVSSAIGQSLNIPNGIAFLHANPKLITKGLEMTVKQFKNENAPIRKSGFISERYGRELYRQFDTRWWEQPKRGAEFLLEAVDKMGTSFIWNSVYAKGIADKVADPIRYADSVTHRMVAGRGVGEVPLGQKSQLMQMLIPFTLEVGNAMKVTGEFAKHDRAALLTLLATNFVANIALEHVRGFGGGFDPIGAGIDAGKDLADGKPGQAAGRMVGEFLSNVPAGQFVGSLYPQDGQIAGMDLPSRKQIFGKSDPTRFGTGPAFAEAIKNPLLALLPFGGNQLKKTYGGINAIENGGVSTKSGKQVMFPTSDNNMAQDLQMLLFGPYSTPNARNYFDQNNRPLSELQTKQFKNATNKQTMYDNIQKQRDVEAKKKEAKKGAK
jgi:hypothetical protein